MYYGQQIIQVNGEESARTYCCNPSTITIGVSGVVGTVNSVYTVVTKE